MRRWLPCLTLALLGAVTARPVPAASAQGLLSCYVLGDSIAVGTAQKLPWCWSNTKVGLNTKQALTRFTQIPPADVTVISLGINDRGSRLPTVQNLATLRRRITSFRVIWILPADAGKSAEIQQVATQFQDRIIDLSSPAFLRYLSHVDHLHPNGTGYALIANKSRELAYARP
jgi:lysophospholipase L1-like esterase